jgi:hypothetical protein
VGDAEVGELCRDPRSRMIAPLFVTAAHPRHDHVLRLDVAVDDPALAGVGQRVGERQADPQHVAVRQRSRRGQAVECLAGDQLRDEVARLAVLAGVEDGHDPGMVEPRRGQRLAARALVGAATTGDDLDGDVPAQALVTSREDSPEPAGPQPPAEPVAAEHEAATGRAPGGRQLRGGVHLDLLRRGRADPCRRDAWRRRRGCVV